MKFLVHALVVVMCQARELRAEGFPEAKMRDFDDSTPSVVILASAFVYNVGKPKAIYCQGRNLPETLEWISPSGEPVKERSIHNTRVRTEKMKNSSLEASLVVLIFVKLKIEDSGNWTCRAGQDLKDSIEFFVGEKVQFAVNEQDVEGREDRSVQLICEATGYPEPEVQWLKDNSFIEADGNKYFIYKRRDTHMLEIRDLNYLDPATYVCRATQDRLSYIAQKKFNLRVKHKPVITNVFNQLTRVVEEYVIMNQTKELTCGAIGNPPPRFSWSKHIGSGFDEPMSEDSIFTTPDYTYSILTLHVEDEAALTEYKCSVTNHLGRTYILFHVTLGNKPSPPADVEVKKAEAHNITFNVSCPSCVFKLDDEIAKKPENLSVIGFTFQLVPCTPGVADPNWQNADTYPFTVTYNASNLEFTVTDLQNSTEYHAQVATQNDAGLSDWLAIHPNPITKTTDGAAALTTSVLLLIMAFITTFFY